MPDKEWSYADGMKVTEHEDGSVTVTQPNGLTLHIDPRDGARVEDVPTPAGVVPVPVQPTQPPKDKDGGAERRISYPDGMRVTIFRGPPRRIRITRPENGPGPRHLDVEFRNGVRRVTPQPTQDVPDPPVQETRPEPKEPREINPSTHPAAPSGSKKKGIRKRKSALRSRKPKRAAKSRSKRRQ